MTPKRKTWRKEGESEAGAIFGQATAKGPWEKRRSRREGCTRSGDFGTEGDEQFCNSLKWEKKGGATGIRTGKADFGA